MNKITTIERMDKTLVEIYSIKNIEEVNFTDLMPISTDEKIKVIPSLLIKYNGGKYLNLCSKDKYFDVFVKKVYEIYQKEKDREIKDTRFGPFGSTSKIRIDSKTKEILESGDLTRINEVYKFYDNKKSYNNSLLFQIDELRLILPIIKYHIKKLLDLTDITINFKENEIYGYRNKYTINSIINGINSKVLIDFIKENQNTFSINLKSLEKVFEPMSVKLIFEKDSIIINITIQNNDLSSNDIYKAELDVVNHIFNVVKDGKEIFYKEQYLEKQNIELINLTNIDTEETLTWYKLPWTGYYGINNQVKRFSPIDSFVIMHNKYLGIAEDEFMIKEHKAEVYHRDRTFTVNSNDVVLDEVCKTIYGIRPMDNIYIIETSFDDEIHENGYYDTYLSGRYYYHVIECDQLQTLEKRKLVSISKDDDIITNADLLVAEDVKKLIRGKKNENI